MFNRTQTADRSYWSPFGRPFIFVPASFLSESSNKSQEGSSNNEPEDNITTPSKDQSSIDIQSRSFPSAFVPQLSYMTQPYFAQTDGFMNPNSDTNADRPRQRRPKSRKNKDTQRSEDVPEYKGQMPIDDLLTFINSGRSKKQYSTKTEPKKNARTDSTKNGNGKVKDSKAAGFSVGASNSDSGNSDVESKSFQSEKEPNHGDLNPELPGKANVCFQGSHVAPEMDSTITNWNEFTTVTRKRKGKLKSSPEIDCKYDCNHNEQRLTSSQVQAGKESCQSRHIKKSQSSASSESSDKKGADLVTQSSKSSSGKGKLIQTTFTNCGNEDLNLQERIQPSSNTDKRSSLTNEPVKEARTELIQITKSLTHDSQSSSLTDSNEGLCGTKNYTKKSQAVVFADGYDKTFAEFDLTFEFELNNCKSSSSEGDQCKCPHTRCTDNSVDEISSHEANSSQCKTETSCFKNGNNDKYIDKNREITKPNRQSKTVNKEQETRKNVSPSTAAGNVHENCKEDPNRPETNDIFHAKTNKPENAAEKAETGKVKLVENSKKGNLSFSEKEQRFTPETQSNGNLCALPSPCSGRPVSIVTPNHPTLHAAKMLLSNACQRSGQSLCSCSVHGPGLASSMTVASVRTPVLKVAPMLAEKPSSNQTSEANADDELDKPNCINEGKGSEDTRKNTNFHLDENSRVETKSVQTASEGKNKHLGIQNDCSLISETELQPLQDSVTVGQETYEIQPHICRQSTTSQCQEQMSVNCHQLYDRKERSPCVGPEVRPKSTCDSVTTNTFDLFSAQIFLYKTFQDSLSDADVTIGEFTSSEQQTERIPK